MIFTVLTKCYCGPSYKHITTSVSKCLQLMDPYFSILHIVNTHYFIFIWLSFITVSRSERAVTWHLYITGWWSRSENDFFIFLSTESSFSQQRSKTTSAFYKLSIKKFRKIVLCVKIDHRKKETHRCHTGHSRKTIMTPISVTLRESVK